MFCSQASPPYSSELGLSASVLKDLRPHNGSCLRRLPALPGEDDPHTEVQGHDPRILVPSQTPTVWVPADLRKAKANYRSSAAKKGSHMEFPSKVLPTTKLEAYWLTGNQT